MQSIIEALYVFTYWWTFLGNAGDAAVFASGWGTAILFTIIWGVLFQWYTVKRPANVELIRSLDLVCREISQNIQFSSTGGLVIFISTRFYDQVGSKVLLSIDKGGGDALDVVYRTFQLVKQNPRYLEQDQVIAKFQESLLTFCNKTLSAKQSEQLLAAWEQAKVSVSGAKIAG